jgi:hypothetical protein
VAVFGWASWTFFTAITVILTILSAALSILALIAAWSGRRRGISIVAAALCGTRSLPRVHPALRMLLEQHDSTGHSHPFGDVDQSTGERVLR